MSARWTRSALLIAGACARRGGVSRAPRRPGSTPTASSAAKTVNVAVIYRKTGGLAPTARSTSRASRPASPTTEGKSGGDTINLTYVDDATDPATAFAIKNLIGQGYKIIAGTASSGVALQEAPIAAQNHVLFISGPAAADAITGLNKYTFRSGRQTYRTSRRAASSRRRRPARRSSSSPRTRRSAQGNYAAVKAIIGGKDHNVTTIHVPFSAADFTPFAQQVKHASADLPSSRGPARPRRDVDALDQQDVSSEVDRHRPRRAGDLPALRAALEDRTFLSHYLYQAPNNKVNT